MSSKSSKVPTSFHKTEFHLRAACSKASDLAKEFPPKVYNELKSKPCNKWSQTALGCFMTQMNVCHSIDGDDLQMISIIHKYSEWAMTR